MYGTAFLLFPSSPFLPGFRSHQPPRVARNFTLFVTLLSALAFAGVAAAQIPVPQDLSEPIQDSLVTTNNDPDSSGQFPLQMGNLWQLWDENFNDLLESEVVGDTTFPNGETYTIVDGFGAGFGRYVRQEGSRVLAYSTEDSTEQSIYDFAADVGDTISGSEWTGFIVLEDKHPVFFYGRTLTEWTFGICCLAWVSLIDSIGLSGVAFEPGIQIYTFQGAIVNGVQYGTITDIVGNQTSPSMFQLHQNYPNPFNPSTMISFSLPRSGDVSLKIFNLLGEEVATLVSGQMDAGIHTVQWDATGQPSGVYFYRLHSGDYEETRKLVLLR